MNHSILAKQGAQQNILGSKAKLGVNGRIPSLKIGNVELANNKRANRYLEHQMKRIHKLIKQGYVNKATRIYSALIMRSGSLKAYGFNKVARGGYFSLKLESVQKVFEKFVTLCKTHDANPVVKRSYIPKSNGKLRPIGSPTLEGRVYLAMWEGFLRLAIEDQLPDGQHGFRKGRSGLTAWKMIGEKRSQFRYCFEFDLESCFNLLKATHITDALENAKIPSELRGFIERVNLMYPLIKIDELLPEKEIEVSYDSLMKKGMTQGNPGSPLLAILLIGLKMEKLKMNLVMYADDGLAFSDNIDDFKRLNDKSLVSAGIKLSTKLKENGDSVNGLVNGEMKFVGLTYDGNKDLIKIGDSGVPRKMVTDKMLKKLVGNSYENQNKSGKGGINRDSGLARRLPNTSSMDMWYKLITDITEGRRNTLLRYEQYVFEYTTLSTLACAGLLYRTKTYNKGTQVLNYFHKIYSEPSAGTYFRNILDVEQYGMGDMEEYKEYYPVGYKALLRRRELYRKFFGSKEKNVRYLKTHSGEDLG